MARFRAMAALATGAYVLHQLRYLLSYGESAGPALEREGHAYLEIVLPAITVLLLCAALQFGAELMTQRAAPARRPSSLALRWAALASALLLTYVVQESLEGALAAGHPAGAAAFLGSGGWAAAPLAAGLGLGLALVLDLADAAVSSRAAAATEMALPMGARACPRAPLGRLQRPLAVKRASRAPPASPA